MEFIACNTDNYRAGRTQPVRYIVMHYTANNGDTARNNCDYYHRVGGLQASAHYFCDEYGAMQSVREGDTAWHCGAEAGRRYWHPECRNANSIGIEMCSRKRADGSYYILPETVANAAALAREIMQRYGIDTEHVVRHYDVTGKRCPMPWVDDPAQWAAFLAMLTPEHQNEEEEEDMVRYSKIEDVPAWARSTIKEMMDAGLISGVGGGNLDLSADMLRMLYVMWRMRDTRYGRIVDGKVTNVPDWALDSLQALADKGALAGVGDGKLGLSMDMMRTLVVCQRMMEDAAR